MIFMLVQKQTSNKYDDLFENMGPDSLDFKILN